MQLRGSRMKSNANASLVIRDLQEADSGTYECVVIDGARRGTSQVSHLKVYQAPRVTTSATRVAVLRGASATLRCDVTGIPTPVVEWRKRGEDTLPPSSVADGQLGTLLFPRVEENHGGEYMCVASNVAGTDQGFIHLEVRVPPSIVNETQVDTVKVVKGSTIALTCPSTGMPNPKVTWLKDGSVLSGTELRYIEVYPEGLHITYVNTEAAGRYTCVATNVAGTAQKEFLLDVLGKVDASRP
ncbi:hemicentin-2-like [Ornithodoros turicata]|uniref:hemicentin-2-like n=1 Tax=Ornithodoros turicata TaxID=34597 RepID=UPI003139B657